jgi:hypothetical protein
MPQRVRTVVVAMSSSWIKILPRNNQFISLSNAIESSGNLIDQGREKVTDGLD